MLRFIRVDGNKAEQPVKLGLEGIAFACACVKQSGRIHNQAILWLNLRSKLAELTEWLLPLVDFVQRI